MTAALWAGALLCQRGDASQQASGDVRGATVGHRVATVALHTEHSLCEGAEGGRMAQHGGPSGRAWGLSAAGAGRRWRKGSLPIEGPKGPGRTRGQGLRDHPCTPDLCFHLKNEHPWPYSPNFQSETPPCHLRRKVNDSTQQPSFSSPRLLSQKLHSTEKNDKLFLIKLKRIGLFLIFYR